MLHPPMDESESCGEVTAKTTAMGPSANRSQCEQGHDVRLIPAPFVKPFVQSNKNEFLDAEAIVEAVDRKNMRFVPIKTDDQLDLQTIHRGRDRLIARRTAVMSFHSLGTGNDFDTTGLT